MTDQEKLLSLLNTKDYKSKLRLYCNECVFQLPKKQNKKETDEKV